VFNLLLAVANGCLLKFQLPIFSYFVLYLTFVTIFLIFFSCCLLILYLQIFDILISVVLFLYLSILLLFVEMLQMLSSKDLNFVGYTYKNFEIVNDYQVPGIGTSLFSLFTATSCFMLICLPGGSIFAMFMAIMLVC